MRPRIVDAAPYPRFLDGEPRRPPAWWAMTTTPHDAMFKAAFAKLQHARGLLRELVPEALGKRFTWSTLRLESGIAVGDEDLDEQRMDLVYSVRAGRRRVLIYVLAEQQSKADPWMAFRLLC